MSVSLNSYLIVGSSPYGEGVKDIRVLDGRIAQIGVGLDPENLEVIEAHGRICLPIWHLCHCRDDYTKRSF